MTMMINIQDQYLESFQLFIQSLPQGAITTQKRSLDEEIQKRVEEYKNGIIETTPFPLGTNKLREEFIKKYNLA